MRTLMMDLLCDYLLLSRNSSSPFLSTCSRQAWARTRTTTTSWRLATAPQTTTTTWQATGGKLWKWAARTGDPQWLPAVARNALTNSKSHPAILLTMEILWLPSRPWWSQPCSRKEPARCQWTRATRLARAPRTARCPRARNETNILVRNRRSTNSWTQVTTKRQLAAIRTKKKSRSSWTTRTTGQGLRATELKKKAQRWFLPRRVRPSSQFRRSTLAHSPTCFTNGPNEPTTDKELVEMDVTTTGVWFVQEILLLEKVNRSQFALNRASLH